MKKVLLITVAILGIFTSCNENENLEMQIHEQNLKKINLDHEFEKENSENQTLNISRQDLIQWDKQDNLVSVNDGRYFRDLLKWNFSTTNNKEFVIKTTVYNILDVQPLGFYGSFTVTYINPKEVKIHYPLIDIHWWDEDIFDFDITYEKDRNDLIILPY